MKEEGFILTGILGGAKGVKKRLNDGKEINRYTYLIIVGIDTYKVSSDFDYSSDLMFGDQVSFKVKPSVFNNLLYLRGTYTKVNKKKFISDPYFLLGIFLYRPFLVHADIGSEEQEEESSEEEIDTINIDQVEIIDSINRNTDEKADDVSKGINDISEKVDESKEINKENNQILKDMKNETEEEQEVDYSKQFRDLHEDMQK